MSPVIESYKHLSSLTSQMREAATQSEWERLIELEKQCSQCVETIKIQDAATTLNKGDLLNKAELIRSILADDAEVRKHAEPWMAQLQRSMRSAGLEQRLQQAYSGEY